LRQPNRRGALLPFDSGENAINPNAGILKISKRISDRYPFTISADQTEINFTLNQNRGNNLPLDTILFNDEQLQSFIMRGFAVVHPQVPPIFHDNLCRQLVEEGSPDDHILEKVPQVYDILHDPGVAGALTSILGENYRLERPRYSHSSAPNAERDGEYWHQDYPLHVRFRYHLPRFVNVFYYPQEITDSIGPTAVLPGSQYCMTRPLDIVDEHLTCRPGAVVIMHADLWHQGRPNCGDRIRHMMRFVFSRQEDPTHPSWQSQNPIWSLPRAPRQRHKSIWNAVWRWYHGAQPSNSELDLRVSQHDIPQLLRALHEPDIAVRRMAADDLAFADVDKVTSSTCRELYNVLSGSLYDADEAVRLNAAYALSTLGEGALPTLVNALRAEAQSTWRQNLNRRVTLDGKGNSDFTNPSQLLLPQSIAALGRVAVPALISILREGDEATRSAAAITLACLGRQAHEAASALLDALRDQSEWVRRNAAEALGNMGPLDGSTASAITTAWQQHFEPDILRTCVRWQASEALTHDALVEILRPRGLIVSAADIAKWTEQYAQESDQPVAPRPPKNSVAWRIDESYGLVCGKETYVYRAIDGDGRTIDFYLKPLRGSMSAKAFFKNVLGCATADSN